MTKGAEAPLIAERLACQPPQLSEAVVFSPLFSLVAGALFCHLSSQGRLGPSSPGAGHTLSNHGRLCRFCSVRTPKEEFMLRTRSKTAFKRLVLCVFFRH